MINDEYQSLVNDILAIAYQLLSCAKVYKQLMSLTNLRREPMLSQGEIPYLDILVYVK